MAKFFTAREDGVTVYMNLDHVAKVRDDDSMLFVQRSYRKEGTGHRIEDPNEVEKLRDLIGGDALDSLKRPRGRINFPEG